MRLILFVRQIKEVFRRKTSILRTETSHLANINKDKPIYYIIKAIYSHKSTNWEYKHINHKKKFVFYLRLR